jgi:hypothetical protein
MKNLLKTCTVAVLLASSFAAHASTSASTQARDVTPLSPSAIGVMAKTAVKEPRFAFTLAATKMVDVSLVHGVESSTLKHVRDPAPVLMSVTNTAEVVPPKLREGVVSCDILGESLIIENGARPVVRTDSLSCFDQDGVQVFKARVDGYLVGTDGLLGLPGTDLKAGEKATVVVDRDTPIFRADN